MTRKSVLENYRENGGLFGYLNKQIQSAIIDSTNPYHFSIKLIMSGGVEDKIFELNNILHQPNHPMHLFLLVQFCNYRMKEVAEKIDLISSEQLVTEYGWTAFEYGYSEHVNNYRRKDSSKNGKRARKKRHFERDLVKAEVVRLAKPFFKKHAATHITTKIHKKLIEFIKTNNFKKKDYSTRIITKWINESMRRKK